MLTILWLLLVVEEVAVEVVALGVFLQILVGLHEQLQQVPLR
jgi:hypothetical protein